MSFLYRFLCKNVGDLVEEINQTFHDYVGQIIRIYKEHDYVEFDWVVGPIPIEYRAFLVYKNFVVWT